MHLNDDLLKVALGFFGGYFGAQVLDNASALKSS